MKMHVVSNQRHIIVSSGDRHKSDTPIMKLLSKVRNASWLLLKCCFLISCICVILLTCCIWSFEVILIFLKKLALIVKMLIFVSPAKSAL